MNTHRIVALILPIALVAGLVAVSFGATIEIDRGGFKMLYSKDTKAIYRDPVSLQELKKNPKAFLNLPIKVKIRFHRIEQGLFVPEFTPFSPSSYLNFSAWDADSQLWDEDHMKRDFPLMFVEKDSPAAQDVIRLNQFDIVNVYGEVVSLFENQAWFEVTRIWLEKKSPLTNTVFSHIRLVEDMYEKGMYDLTVGELDRILRYKLSPDLAGMLYKRKGQCLLAQKKYDEAERAFANARPLREADAAVYKGWGTALMMMGEYDRALYSLENSLVFQAKQAFVYSRMGYCRGKMADARIKELSADKDYLAETKPEDIRRREKQVRSEYDPGRMGVTEKIRERITAKEFEDVISIFNLALLDCRKALFIDPANAAAIEWQGDIEKRLTKFKKKSEEKPRLPAPVRGKGKAPRKKK